MTAFYNFSLKIETSLTKKAVKPILKTWNAANVYVCMFKNINTKNSNSKLTKFAIKN